MSSNGEVHGAKLQRENTVLTAACLNEGSKTSISRSHEMKGNIVDVHPVALKQNKKKNPRKGVKTKDCQDRQTEGQTGLKRNEGEKRFKGQEHHQRGDIKRKGWRIARPSGRFPQCFIFRVLFWHEDSQCRLIMDEPGSFTMSVILSAADSGHNSSLFSC